MTAWLILLLAAQAPGPESKRAERVAVYELSVAEGSSVDGRTARVVTDAVTAELRKRQRLSVVSMDEVRAMLDVEAQKQLVGCADDSCLADIADSLGVDGVVIGSIATVGEERVFGLKRLDQRAAKTVGQATRRLVPDDGRELLAAVGEMVQELFADHPLRDGETLGVSDAIVLSLHPPPLPAPLFFSAAGFAALSLIATGVFGTLNLVERADLERTYASAKETAVPGGALNEARARTDALAIATWTAGATTLVACVVAGVMVPFTNFSPAPE